MNFDVRKALKDAYDSAPIIDVPREEADAELDRVVLQEYPAPWPRRNPEDDSVKLPIRLVHNSAMGLGLEIGPYDFNEIDIQMLRQAIEGYDYCNGGKRLTPVDERNHQPDNVVDLNAKHRKPKR